MEEEEKKRGEKWILTFFKGKSILTKKWLIRS